MNVAIKILEKELSKLKIANETQLQPYYGILESIQLLKKRNEIVSLPPIDKIKAAYEEKMKETKLLNIEYNQEDMFELGILFHCNYISHLINS